MEAHPPDGADAAVSAMSLPERLVKVFFSPGELFESLKERPLWFGALGVGAILVVLSVLLIPGEVWLQAMREQVAQRGGEMPPFMESAGTFFRLASVASGFIFWFIWAFVLAGIVTLVFSFLLGDEGRYAQYLSVVGHALFIGAVGSLLLVPLRIYQQDPSLTLNLGTFMPVLEEGYVFRVLKLLDLFGLWGYAVMALGVAKMDPRRGVGFSMAFFMAFAVVFALVFGIFGG
jgi:hypothetical protein